MIVLKLTVDFTPPIFSAVFENAPAKIKINIIKTMFEWPAPFVKTSTFLANDSFRFINNATITVIVIATFNGIEVKSPVIIPTPKNNATNNNKGIMPKHCSFYVLPSFLPAFQLKIPLSHKR